MLKSPVLSQMINILHSVQSGPSSRKTNSICFFTNCINYKVYHENQTLLTVQKGVNWYQMSLMSRINSPPPPTSLLPHLAKKRSSISQKTASGAPGLPPAAWPRLTSASASCRASAGDSPQAPS